MRRANARLWGVIIVWNVGRHGTAMADDAMNETQPRFLAEVIFLTHEQGGRSQPPQTTTGEYRTLIRAPSRDCMLIGVAFESGPEVTVPGPPAIMTLRSIYYPDVPYWGLDEGAEFDVLEGLKVVGSGRILRRL